MTDRAKIIEGLEMSYKYSNVDEYNTLVPQQLVLDAIALLKEQEAVEPKIVPSAKGIFYTCGTCGLGLVEVRDTVSYDDRKRIRFCTWCGKKVKWE